MTNKRVSLGRGRMQGLRRTAIAALLCLKWLSTNAFAQWGADDFNPGANDTVRALVVQDDGKVIVGGDFTMLGGGGTGQVTRNHIGRVNADGTLDMSFNPGANGTITALALQTDGKILVGGDFTTLGGGGMGTSVHNRIARLNTDGSVDESFNPTADGQVVALLVQPDAKILVAGFFLNLSDGGINTRRFIGRLNPDGTLDAAFNPGANANVLSVALQSDAKIVVGGGFTKLGGGVGTIVRNFIGRLNPDGTVDMGYDPGANSIVTSVAVQADDKVVVGGQFEGLGGGTGTTTTREFIGRINTDGTVDSGWNPGANSFVEIVSVQADGKILAGGFFTGLGGGTGEAMTRNYLGRINANGTVDTSFNPGADFIIYALATQPDDKVLAGGDFAMLGGGGTGTAARSHIGRVGEDVLAAASELLNISTRLAVGIDDNVLIGGFIITGSEPKAILLRGIGPSLTQLGVPGALTDPTLELHFPDGSVMTNDNWRDNQEQQIIDTTIPPSDDFESAIVATLDPAAYTVILRGKNLGTGVGLVEAYDLAQAADSTLANISTRGFVQTEDNVMIGGFIVGDGSDSTVVVRGIGPSLADAGVAGALQDPTLELHNSNGDLVESNDDWGDSPDKQQIIDVGLNPTEENESALLATLMPGAYTGILRGDNNTLGVGLVEVYHLQ